MLFTPEVPNLFGTKDRFWGRQVFHELEGGRWFWDDLSTLNLLCPFFLLLLSQLHLRSSSIRSLRLRTSALHSPAHRFLPDLDLGTKFTLCLLNLAHMLQWVSGSQFMISPMAISSCSSISIEICEKFLLLFLFPAVSPKVINGVGRVDS